MPVPAPRPPRGLRDGCGSRGSLRARALLVLPFLALLVGSCVEELDLTDSVLPVPVQVELVSVMEDELEVTARDVRIHRIRMSILDVETGEELAAGDIELDPDSLPDRVRIRRDVDPDWEVALEGTIELVRLWEGEGDEGGEGEGTAESVEWSAFLDPVTISTQEETWEVEVGFGRGSLEEQAVAGVSLVPPEGPLLEGETISLSASTEGGPEGARVFWGSADPEILAVSDEGTLTALLPGSASVIAASGRAWAAAEVQVLQRIEAVAVEPSEATLTGFGEEITFQATPLDPRGDEVADRSWEVEWEIDDPEVAAHRGDGRFQALAPGEATVTATIEGASGTALLAVDYETGGTFEGDITILDQGDVDLFAAAGWEEVDGDVIIGGEGSTVTNLDGMETLRRVTRRLVVADAPALTDISGLSALETAGIQFQIRDNPVLAELPEFGSLATAGRFHIWRNAGLRTMGGFPALVSVPTEWSVLENESLEALPEFPVLGAVQRLIVRDNPSMAEMGGFPVLERVTGFGGLVLEGNDALETLPAFPALVTVDRAVQIGDHESLVTLGGFPSLQSAEAVRIVANLSLEAVGAFSALSQLGGNLELLGNLSLSDLGGFPTLGNVAGSLHVVGNPALQDLDALSGLTSTLQDLLIDANDGLTDISGLSNVGSATEAFPAVLGGFTVTDNPNLPTSQAQELADLLGVGGAVTIVGNLDDGAAPVHEGDLAVFDEEDLAAFAANGWEEVDGNLTIGGPESPLVDLGGMETLLRVTGDLEIRGTPALLDISALAVLEEVGGAFEIAHNEVLSGLPEFAVLVSSGLQAEGGGDLSIRGNTALEAIGGFPGLLEVAGNVQVDTNAVLAAVPGFPALVSVGGALLVGGNPALESVGAFPLLSEIGGVFWIAGNEGLTEVAGFPALASVGGLFRIGANPSLTGVGPFAELASVGTFVQFLDNEVLGALPELPALASIGGNLVIQRNASIQDLDPLTGVTATIQDLLIDENAALSDMQGLGSLGSADGAEPAVEGDFTVTDNPNLPTSQAEELAELLGVGGTVTIEGNLDDAPQIASIEVSPGFRHFFEIGESQAYTAAAFDVDGNEVEGVTFEWSVNREQVASVDPDGIVIALADGEAEVTASAGGVAGQADLRVTRHPDASLEMAFQRWWQVTGNPNGPAPFLSTATFQHSSMWSNFGMVDYSIIPREPIPNDSTALFYPNFRNAWTWSYEALDHVARALQVVEEGLYEDVDVMRAAAYGRFLQGLAHGTLALLFDQAAIYDETVEIDEGVYWSTHAPHLLPMEPYTVVMEAALGYLTEAIQLAQSGTFVVPFEWFPATTSITEEDLVRIVFSYRARFRANVARTPAEGAAVDWGAVLADLDMGVQNDVAFQFGGNIGGLPFQHDSYYFTHEQANWSQLNYFIHGMADQTEQYITWMDLAVADRTPFLIITPDQRFPQGETVEIQRSSPGTRFLHPETYTHSQPARGTWRWSYYVSARDAAAGQSGQVADLSMDELRLLRAEAALRIGDDVTAADLINVTRTAAGLAPTDPRGGNSDCVPALPDGSCGDLFEMLKWEKRLMGTHNAGNLMAAWFLEGRRWGDLLIGTFVHFPVPEEVLAQAGIPVYTWGGVGQPGSSEGSIFDP